MITTLSQLRKSPIAKTDVGDLIVLNGTPEIEFLVKGTIKKIRAGLFFIDIEGEQYTFPKNSNFKENQELICVLRAEVDSNNVDIDNNNAKFIIKGIENV
ncbi:MAG: hypothetical protein AB7V77_05155 [Candidatus Woesearchaeota archaeon]